MHGYDAHFIMQEIGKIGKEKNLGINCVPNNMERYMACKQGNSLAFLDSFQFMSSGLDRLAANLPEDKYEYTSGVFKKEQLALMEKKGVYPYDFMDSFQKFDYKQLPTKDEFFGILTQEGITNEQYQHAQQVWDTFKMKSMGEYHDLYLKSDVLLLADVFENFRSTYLQYYKLDLAYYFTSPALAGVQCLVKLMNSWNFSVNSHLLKYVSLCNDLRTNLLSNHADDT